MIIETIILRESIDIEMTNPEKLNAIITEEDGTVSTSERKRIDN